MAAISKLPRDPATRNEVLLRYERVTELPMVLLAAAIIPLIVLPLALDLNPALDRGFFAFDWIIWAAFAGDLTFRTYLAERRGRYLLHHWYDVVIVVVPFLRPLRLVRSARLFRVLRLARAGSLAARVFEESRALARKFGAGYVVAAVGVTIVACAALVFAFERNGDGKIDSFATALWWALVTVTTVGYGDTVPVTAEGRVVAVFLMIVGISLFGFLTATIAAFLVEHDRRNPHSLTSDMIAKLDSIEAELRQLRQELGRPDTPSGPGQS